MNDSSEAGLGDNSFMGANLAQLVRALCTAGELVPYSKVLGSNPTGGCYSLAIKPVLAFFK